MYTVVYSRHEGTHVYASITVLLRVPLLALEDFQYFDSGGNAAQFS